MEYYSQHHTYRSVTSLLLRSGARWGCPVMSLLRTEGSGLAGNKWQNRQCRKQNAKSWRQCLGSKDSNPPHVRADASQTHAEKQRRARDPVQLRGTSLGLTERQKELGYPLISTWVLWHTRMYTHTPEVPRTMKTEQCFRRESQKHHSWGEEEELCDQVWRDHGIYLQRPTE